MPSEANGLHAAERIASMGRRLLSALPEARAESCDSRMWGLTESETKALAMQDRCTVCRQRIAANSHFGRGFAEESAFPVPRERVHVSLTPRLKNVSMADPVGIATWMCARASCIKAVRRSHRHLTSCGSVGWTCSCLSTATTVTWEHAMVKVEPSGSVSPIPPTARC